ncbi:hypothetical protein BCR36DRAFT_585122 [Piromyces finnis]|uniref:AP-1 complex subunit gamma n=1 Tax=Piromyces finnis TaxID=1754191 RepID=A0A1Y1V3W2_9FUNG|nr:hypothetical protein BCR36DRAFT_585122 [Piromyces finnis]|eukprot:ORX46656.1 hypothetical protein BCR36DRAFT_585122 [Piromyces finnis]
MDIQISNLINKFTALHLKDLIKAVRACKTAADERAVIAKESANIRTSFKEDDSHESRNNNISKLLYIHMLGYPAHFGQIECLKLVASPRFSDKRVGYLGIMLLLDENQEILTLVTNSIKNDLNHGNMYIVGLALCTLGNISSVEMARDLSNEVEKLLGSTSSYIRKKAALCALRIIKKVPELTENYIQRAKKLLGERHHGVLLTAITLLTEMCKQDQAVTKEIRKYVPHLVKILRGLTTNEFSAEHNVNNISDPFLQVKILRLLRILGHKNQRASEAMNDILAQVVTNTEGSKNTGNAVLYEAVLTIIYVESENSLRVLAINILGRFLANSDNNIKYVALMTLTTVADTGFASTSTLQRHRKIILDCLKDVDISIRHRALDLSFSLLNSQNIRAMTRELLNYLEVAPVNEKSSVIRRICESASIWKPNSRWEIDTICRVLTIAGNSTEQDIINHFIKLISVSPGDLQQYITRKLYGILSQDDEKILEQEGLILAGAWCIGEYGDMLVGNDADKVLGGLLSEDNNNEDAEENSSADIKPSEDDVIILLNKLIEHFCNNNDVCNYILTALAKLTTRFSSSSKEKCRSVISRYVVNTDMEIQQRAVEYNEFLKLDEATITSLMERIPPLEGASKLLTSRKHGKSKDSIDDGIDLLDDIDNTNSSSGNLPSANDLLGLGAPAATAPQNDNIMDLLGGLSLGGSTMPTVTPTQNNSNAMDLLGSVSTSTPSTVKSNSMDLLGDIFGNSTNTNTTPVTNATASPINLMSPLSNSGLTPATNTRKTYIAYEKNGLKLEFIPKQEPNNITLVKGIFSSNNTINQINLQIAVQKALRLQMNSPSGNSVSPGNNVIQFFKLLNPTNVPIKLRLRISYQLSSGQAINEIVEFNSFMDL